jgi:hypothetical protein
MEQHPMSRAEGVISGTPYWRTDEEEYCATIGGRDIVFPSFEMLEAALRGGTLEPDYSNPVEAGGTPVQAVSSGEGANTEDPLPPIPIEAPDDQREAKELRQGRIVVVVALLLGLLLLGILL